MPEVERQYKVEAIKRMAEAGNPCLAILGLLDLIEADRSRERLHDIILESLNIGSVRKAIQGVIAKEREA